MDVILAIFSIFTVFCFVIMKFLKRNISLKDEGHKTITLADDLKSLYDNAIFSDVKLQTSTKTFPAHKAILSARSDVFKNMFSTMKEKNNGPVLITDLEDETVNQLLTFIYTDSLGDLTKESAIKLYKAADRYYIMQLRQSCASFLMNNLRPNEACDVFLLAHRHQDKYLKNHLQSYILQHGKEIFSTQKWKQFMASNLQLAAEVMYQKVSQPRM